MTSYSDKFSSQGNSYSSHLSAQGNTFSDKLSRTGAAWNELLNAWTSYSQTWDELGSTVYTTKY